MAFYNTGIGRATRGQLSHALVLFADGLAPTDEFDSEGKRLVQAVVVGLQALPRQVISISRVYYDGSIGKNTSVIQADFDCVVFVNDRETPLLNELTLFENFLVENATKFHIDPVTIRRKRVACTFTFRNGMEVDLLPACNFAINPQQQYTEVLHRIRGNPGEGNIYLSSSLVEQQIEFIRIQPGHTHQLIRLAKYWFKSLSLGENIFGGSFFMEILGVVVWFEESPYESIDLIERFKRLLQKVSVWRTLRIAFVKENNTWKLLKSGEFSRYTTYFNSNLATRVHFIMKPTNPYQDMSSNVSPAVAIKLERFAGEMLERIALLESPGSNEMKTLTNGTTQIIHVDKLFQPFPMRLSQVYDISAIPKGFLIEYGYPFDSPNTKIEERNMVVLERHDETCRKVAKCVLNNLLYLIRGKSRRNGENVLFPRGYPNVTQADVREAVLRFINFNYTDQIFEVPLHVSSNTNHLHNSYDVTLYVPYLHGLNVFALRFSMKW